MDKLGRNIRERLPTSYDDFIHGSKTDVRWCDLCLNWRAAGRP